jgi:S1-C subfamily serine protease
MKTRGFSSLLISLSFVAMLLFLDPNSFAQIQMSLFSKPATSEGIFQGSVVLAQNSDLEISDELAELLGSTAARNENLEGRLAGSLQTVGKNLILESTRGPKEMSIYVNAAPAVVYVVTQKALGSGVIIDEQGHVITNWHVIENASKVGVVFKPKDAAELKKELAFYARVEKIDQVADLALLKIEKPPQPTAYLKIGDASKLAVGQDVHAIGHPEGAIWTYTKGLISQIRPNFKWTYSDGTKHSANVVQTQTPIFHGSSGGPLIDDSGDVVGITSFGGESQVVNFAVAADEIQMFLQRKESRSTSTVARPQKPPSDPSPSQQARCSEAYDTDGHGRNVFGCYTNKSATPPPNFWFVRTRGQYPASYMALASRRGGPIDTVALSPDGLWRTQWHYMDTNCDGLLDLVGHLSSGSKDFESYRRPERKLYLNEMASELLSGLKTGKIPYPNIRVCQ